MVLEGSNITFLSKFITEVFSYEKKKLILPALMCLLLFGSVLYSIDLRDNQMIDEKAFNHRSEFAVNSHVEELEEDFYPKKVNQSRYKDDYSGQKEFFSNFDFVVGSPAVLATESPLYPLSPHGFSFSDNLELTNPLFSRNEGYVASKERWVTTIERFYRVSKLLELRSEINRTDMSHKRFQERVDMIKNSEYEEEKVRNYVFSKINNQSNIDGSRNFGSLSNVDSANNQFLEKIENNELKEVNLIHFIPTFVATFVMYYMISGILIVGWRDFKYDIEKYSSKNNFFRNNILLAACLSSITALMIQIISNPTTLSYFRLIFLSLQVIVSSFFWILLFSVIVNELRKKTKYAWILSGISLNLVLLIISYGNISYNNGFLVTIFILGATPIYPILLGITSEYGRIHGERFLRQKLSM